MVTMESSSDVVVLIRRDCSCACLCIAHQVRTSYAAAPPNTDALEHWSRALDARRVLGSTSVPITDMHGEQRTYRASLTASQARVCLLEAQTASVPLALGNVKVSASLTHTQPRPHASMAQSREDVKHVPRSRRALKHVRC